MTESTQPKKPAAPKRPPRQSVGMADKFDLPAFIKAADKKKYYYRYILEERWFDVEKAWYDKVIDPSTNQVYKMPSKSSEQSLILVRQEMRYRKEDLAKKAERNNSEKNVKLPAGFKEAYNPD